MKRYGLLGRSLKHSFSKAYFSEKFREASIDAQYDNYEIPSIDELPWLLENNPGLCGLNVTIPYKEAVLPFLDEMDAIVQATGACNCITIEKGRLHGFNTDVPGFLSALQSRLQPSHHAALVLGSGGAARAVRFALQTLSIQVLTVSRSGIDISYEDLNASIMETYRLVINTTPLGMYPDTASFPPVPYEYLSPGHFLFDLVYNPEKTVFLEKGAERGAQVENGYRMLIAQAEESWKIWNA